MKTKILLMDDESIVTKEILSKLNTLVDDWEFIFFNNCANAVKKFDSEFFDIVITRMEIGAKLLEVVKSRYPNIIRILYSKDSEKEQNLKSTYLAHQQVDSITEYEDLQIIIGKLLYSRKFINNENLTKLIGSIDYLPTLPDIYFKIEKEIQNENFSTQKVASIITEDITLTAKLLQLVNSSFFGLPRKMTNLNEIINFLGANIIKSLVVYTKVFTFYNTQGELKEYIKNIWNHSIKVGRLTKKILAVEKQPRLVIDKAFIAGILHDIGKLVLIQLPNYYNNVKSISMQENILYQEAEYRLYGSSHSEVGAYLLGIWGFDDDIVHSVNTHHDISNISQTNPKLSQALFVSNIIADINEYDDEYIDQINLRKTFFKWIDITRNIFN